MDTTKEKDQDGSVSNTGETGADTTSQLDDSQDTSGNDVTEASQDGTIESERPLQTDEEEEEEIVNYCLICNKTCDKTQPDESYRKESQHYTSAISSEPVTKQELKQLVFIALSIEENEASNSPIADPNYRLPLCSACKHKCGQLKHISLEISRLEREFDRIREAMAFTICDVVGNELHIHEYDDETDPLRKARQIRQNEINYIQEFVHKNWWYRYPSAEEEMHNLKASQQQSINSITSMKETVRNLPYHRPPAPKLPKGTTVAYNQKFQTMSTDNQNQASFARNPKSMSLTPVAGSGYPPTFKPGSISISMISTAPTRIRRTAATVQRERSEMLRQGIKLPHLVGGFRKMKPFGTGFRKQAPSLNHNGSGFRNPSPQVHRMNMGHSGQARKGFMQQQAHHSPSPKCNLQEQINDFDDSNTNNDHMEQMNEDSGDGESGISGSGDWNTSQNEGNLEDFMNNFGLGDGAGHFLEGGGHFLEGGGHFMEGGGGHFLEGGGGGEFDDSGSFDNMDDDSRSSMNADQDDIEYHQNEEGLYVCTFCNKQFIHKYPYRDHLKTHTGEGPKCHVCGKIFPKNHNLMLHMRTHTGEKPFQCEICKKGFADKSNLKVHMRVHTGERPYQCECGLSFVNSSRLVVHRKLHEAEMAEKLFSCDICQKTFGTSNQLHSHRKNHFITSSNATQVQLKQERRERVQLQEERSPQAVNAPVMSSRSGRTIIPKRRV